ncbi:phosphonoacetaldehyde hydrolase [Caminicella sporogenes DSM 14501]|uniref:Phosphonoacetaldehyde hydrolase n=1 Tax=Caminicella sporogenes DSM 14501 TaxID=1121266 RepID=A0A1M6S327_9FIRM|nr:phosphonoacetaldehyde hydrolase [Caminicella sporogenes]RKD27173.1 phosphonoacetaldehyde hydrolase [Caminicella sporogenes]SHK38908.1 phosphonoacetaldehyde hydrolase [Caminicella sporogenes DSM 14501]
MKRVEGVIFDWAGTTVDFGCIAPINAFIEIFKMVGIDITLEEAREPMGMLKRDHIKTILQMPRISKLWEKKYGKSFDEKDINKLYSKFEKILMESLSQYTDPIPYVLETVEFLREQGIKIGSTTGYTNNMMKIVVKGAKDKGYSPDFWVTPDTTKSYGRPYPYMIFRNMEALGLLTTWKVVKVGDTVADIKEGVNSGVWSVGVAVGSSQMGVNIEQFNSLSKEDKMNMVQKVKEVFLKAGADFVVENMSELPMLIEKINILIGEGKRPGI